MFPLLNKIIETRPSNNINYSGTLISNGNRRSRNSFYKINYKHIINNNIIEEES